MYLNFFFKEKSAIIRHDVLHVKVLNLSINLKLKLNIFTTAIDGFWELFAYQYIVAFRTQI